MAATEVPSAGTAPAIWYVGRGTVRKGPYRLDVLVAAIRAERLRGDDWVWRAGMPDWMRADCVPDLEAHFPPDEAPPGAAVAPAAPSSLSSATRATSESDDEVANEAHDDDSSTDADAPAPRWNNYFARHWRGDLPLPISYWINTALLGAVVGGAAVAAAESGLAESFGMRGTGWWILGVFGVITVLSVWQIVGTWRSASRHVSRGGSSGWATVAHVLMVIGALQLVALYAVQWPQLSQGFKLVRGVEDIPPAELRVLNRGTELEVSGGLSFGTTDKVRTLLDAAPSVRVVHLNSVGGWIVEGTKLSELIAERELTTYVSSSCESACTLAFMGGRSRLLGRGARLGFHEGSVGGVGGAVAEEAQRQQRELLLSHGVSGDFVARALATPASDMWYPEADELVRAKVVTAIVDAGQFGRSGVAGWREPEELLAEYDAVPLHAALRSAEPALYAAMRASYEAMLRAGTPANEYEREARVRYMMPLVLKYSRIAPDDAVLRYWTTQIDEMKALRAKDAQLCFDFAFPQLAAEPVDLATHLPAELLAADLEAAAALIEAGARDAVTPPSATAGQQLIARVIERLEPTHARVFATGLEQKHAAEPVCDALVAFYEGVAALPPRDAARAFRYVASQAGAG